MLAGVLAALDAKIKALEEAIVSKERWEVQERTRTDVNAEEGTVEAALAGKEVQKVSVLTGAEAERVKLAALLKQRAKFVGEVFDDEDDDDSEDVADKENVASQQLLKPPGGGREGGLPMPPGSPAAGGGGDAVRKMRKQKKKKSAATGFGQHASVYGLGMRYDAAEDEKQENDRFLERVDEDELAEAVRRRGRQWVTGQALAADPKVLEEKAKKVNRSRLVYSGISA
jgi:hypothetical protein